MNSIFHRISVRKYEDKPVEKEKRRFLYEFSFICGNSGILIKNSNSLVPVSSLFYFSIK